MSPAPRVLSLMHCISPSPQLFSLKRQARTTAPRPMRATPRSLLSQCSYCIQAHACGPKITVLVASSAGWCSLTPPAAPAPVGSYCIQAHTGGPNVTVLAPSSGAGSYTWTAAAVGSFYIFCPVPGHCSMVRGGKDGGRGRWRGRIPGTGREGGAAGWGEGSPRSGSRILIHQCPSLPPPSAQANTLFRFDVEAPLCPPPLPACCRQCMFPGHATTSPSFLSTSSPPQGNQIFRADDAVSPTACILTSPHPPPPPHPGRPDLTCRYCRAPLWPSRATTSCMLTPPHPHTHHPGQPDFPCRRRQDARRPRSLLQDAAMGLCLRRGLQGPLLVRRR